MTLKHFEPDPTYGQGVYRRSLRFVRAGSAVAACLDDTHHAIWVRISHRDSSIADIAAGITRGPATSCGGAPANLSAVVGTDLRASPNEISARLPGSLNCTHLSDLVRWAMQAAARPVEICEEYDIVVPDQTGAPVWIEIIGDGASLHRWQIQNDCILQPAELSGTPLFKGFLAQVRRRLDPIMLTPAIMLQRGAWVARGRRYRVDDSVQPLSAAEGMRDACFSYSGVNRTTATNNLGYVRDFTNAVIRQPMPEQLKDMVNG